MACCSPQGLTDNLRLLFRVKKNQIRMMQDRGYGVDNELPLLSYTLEQFIQVYSQFATQSGVSTVREMLSAEYHHPINNYRTYVYYAKLSKGDVSKQDTTDFISIVDSGNFHSYILITNNKLNSAANEAVKGKSKRIERFIDNELATNPTDHVNVPEHIGLSPAQGREILQRNNWNAAHMPKLVPFDPIVKYYGFTRGQIVKIKRFNPIPGTMVDNSDFYRIVTDSSSKAAYISIMEYSESYVEADDE